MIHFTVLRNRRYQAYLPLVEKIDCFNTLEVEVYYHLGGINYFSGQTTPRGYRVGFKPCNEGNGMIEYTLMSADKKIDGGCVTIETADRYNAKRLMELAELIDPKVLELQAAYEAQDKDRMIALCRVGKVDIKPVAPVAVAMKSNMMILTAEIKAKLPALYTHENAKPEDVPIAVKFFDPTGSWSWYATEGEKIGTITEGAFAGEDDYRFFGYVQGFEGEMGYFTLGELSTAKVGASGMAALPIERDRHFKGTLADVVKA